jgi:drug/metabolite transporter (DMT)-like permease
MYFVVALSALFCMAGANLLALTTLFSSAWQGTALRIERRLRLSRIALYSVLVSVLCKLLLAPLLSPRSNLPLGAGLFTLVLAGVLPLLAYQRTSRAREAVELRRPIKGSRRAPSCSRGPFLAVRLRAW